MALGITSFHIGQGSSQYGNSISRIHVDTFNNVWVLYIVNNFCYIIRLRASDGAYLKHDGTVGTLADATYNFGTIGINSILADPDGLHFWIACDYHAGSPSPTAYLYRVLISTGAIDHTYSGINTTGITAEHFDVGMVTDGTNMYVPANQPSVSGSPCSYYIFPFDTSQPHTRIDQAFSKFLNSIAYDGTDIWVHSPNLGGILKRTINAAPLFTVAGTTNYYAGIAPSPDITWMAQSGNVSSPGKILRVRTSDGAYLKADLTTTTIISEATIDVGGNNSGLTNILYDAVSNTLWSLDWYAGAATQYPYPGVIAGSQYAQPAPGIGQYVRSPFVTGAGSVWAAGFNQLTYVSTLLKIDYVAIIAQYATLIEPFRATRRFAHLALLPADANTSIAHEASLMSLEASCPPTIEYVNAYSNQPPLKTFVIIKN
jgi:hypothetical protein